MPPSHHLHSIFIILMLLVHKISNVRIDNNEMIVYIQCRMKCEAGSETQCYRDKLPKCRKDLQSGEPNSLPMNSTEELDLPPIPEVLEAHLYENRKDFAISWQIPLTYKQRNKAIAYHVEVRYYTGVHPALVNASFNDWQWQHVSKIAEHSDMQIKIKRTKASLRVKYGRWYQFRVAAINKNGFRGYSAPSEQFGLPRNQRQLFKRQFGNPRSPTNLTILNATVLTNGLVSVRLAWCQPRSDLPIEKHMVSWALHLQVDSNHSLFMEQAYVMEPLQYIDINNLEINSSYYFQVQAFSIYGRSRLKSPKDSVFFNTTPPWTITYPNLKCIEQLRRALSNNVIEDKFSGNSHVDVAIIPSKRFVMVVKIFNITIPPESILALCHDEQNCGQNEYRAIKTKAKTLYYSGLKFNMKYVVCLLPAENTLSQEDNGVCRKVLTSFESPNCECWISMHPKLNITCNTTLYVDD